MAVGPKTGLEAIFNKRGGTDPIGALAKQLIDLIRVNPELANEPSFVEAYKRVVNGSNQADLGVRADMLAKDAAPSVNKAIATEKTRIATEEKARLAGDVVKAGDTADQGEKDFYETNLAPRLGQYDAATAAAAEADKRGLEALTGAKDQAAKTQAEVIAEQQRLAGGANAESAKLYGDYKGQLEGLNAEDAAGLANYLKMVDPLRGGIAAIGSDPDAVAAQQAALQRAIGIAGGSLSYESEAAKAFADPLDVANQRKALADIQKDIDSGDQDQRDALNTIKSRTGVTPTAQEALLYELNRRSRESQDASSRAAVMEQQKARGLRSGGAELASMQQAGQQTAQDRLLQDMAANAGAVQRAQSYTTMQGNMANAMRMNAQTGLGMQGDLSTAIRNASFDEAWKRGQGADTASANNQSTMLGGAELQVNSSNAIRTASDTMNMHKDDQAQADAKRRADLEAKIAEEGRVSTAQRGGRNTEAYNTGEANVATALARNSVPVNTLQASIDPAFGREQTVANAIAGNGERNVNRAGAGINVGSTVGALRAGAYSPTRSIAGKTFQIGEIEKLQDEDEVDAF